MGLCLGLAALWNAPANAADEIRMSPEQAARVGIEVAPLSGQVPSRGTMFTGRITIPSNQISVVAAPIAARIDALDVVEDQRVTEGAVIARLNSPALIRAQSEYLQAVNQEKFLQETLNREQALSSDRTVSLKQMQATRNEAAQAGALVAERRQMLRDYGMSDASIDQFVSSRTFDSRANVLAPVTGVVIELLVAVGQRVEAQTPLLRMARLSPLWLELHVSPDRAGRFAPGTVVEVAGQDVLGKVVAVGVSADKSTQAVTVRVELTDAESKLRPGQFVEGFVRHDEPQGKSWSIRPESIIRRGKEAFVFVRTPAGFQPLPVTILQEDRDAVRITGDLQGSESIAVRGLVALKGALQGLGGAN
ncbi:MAG: hypothetical protein ABS35_18900 [Kaistia sp. SCN 65-12]|nr:MAG: hypothetical protein ABS35_18900 [Kaistia sp. SCN 65-12]